MSSTTLPKRFASNSRQPQLSRQKLYAAMLIASQWMAASPLWAAPEGGEVVGGEGVITQNGVDTLIHQASDRLAIDWRSFDVAANERVEFIQPNSSSIALNRVLSNSASHILGRIDSNGQVMLVNPNGVVFGKDSIINVGGMIASGMSIDPASFINGDFTLNSLEGTDGKVINYGIINAATGGSVTLVGQQVQNNGLISAKLGAVNLAAGNEAVLTFDPSGLVGVKVTEAVLQQALGVDAAVINNGTINADGGRVLLSASVSEDIFSDAVNNGGMNKTSSVVMHEDGSFTLGAGADVINTGHIDTSVANGAAGKVVVVGNNVTSNGTITANTGSGTAGAIELHSTDTTLVTESGAISAQATTQGHGGDIKVLGNKVGLLDNAQVNASGANGGGQVLIGGDKTGQNLQIRNADFIYLGKDSSVKTDALINGNGGKLITFASDTARIYGNLYSRGGSGGGNGGFIETSGLKGFEILNTPDITATAGSGGTWLIDPYSIVIGSGQNNTPSNGKTFTSNGGNAQLSTTNIKDALENGSTVIVQTGGSAGDGNGNGDITVSGRITFDINNGSNGDGTATLRLLAHGNINIGATIERDNDNDSTNNGQNNANNTGKGILNIELIANKDNVGGGNIDITNGVNIATNGGYFYAGKSAAEIDGRLDDDYTNKIVDFTSIGATINTSGAFGGGDIVINATNNVSLGVLKFGYDYENAYEKPGSNTSATNLVRVGSVSVNAGGDVTLGGAIDFNNTGKRKNNGEKGYIGNTLDGEDTLLKINALGNITIDALISDAGYGDARDALDIDLTAGNAITINAGIYTAGGNFTTSSQTFNSSGRLINTDRANSNPSDTITDVNGNGIQNGNAQWSNRGNITINAASTVTLGSLVTDAVAEKGERQGNLIIQGINQTDGISTDSLTVTQSGSLDIAGTSTFNLGTGGNITLLDDDNRFAGSLSFVSANNVEVKNTKATVLDDSEITSTFVLVSDGISQDEGKKLIIGGDTSLNSGTKNIVFNGSVNSTESTESTEANLTLIGGDISFANAVGGIKRLGEFTITSTGEVKFQSIDATPAVAQDISAKSLSVTAAKSFTSGNITTAGGDVDITASDSITVQSINTSADTAGKIALTVNGNGDEKSITINGDLNAQNTDGSQNDVVLTLEDTSAAGTINLKHTSFFSSDVTLTGLGEKNTLNALNVDNTWELTADNTGTITITGNTNSKKINFSGFENINGGSEGDAFIVKNNSKFTGLINGGAGANSLNIADESNTDAYAIAVADIYDENASLTVKGITTIVGNNHNDTSLIIASGNNEWIIDGIDKGMVSLVSFEQIKNLMGGEGNDSFKFGAAGQITGSINGGSGNNSITAREADTLWMINGENSGSLGLASEVGTRYLESFSNVQHLIGTEANDTFIFTNDAKVELADGKDGFDTADLSQITTDITVTIDETSEYGFTSVEKIIANENANFTLAATSGNNNWSIDSSNAGQVNGIQFVDFKILQGGSDIDTFTIDTNFAGSIYGGAGNDIFNINAQVGSIFGGNGDDRFVFFEVGSVTTASGNDGDDIVDLSNLTAARIITLNGTSINNVDSVSRVIANSAYDFTLEATSGNNIWRIYDFDDSGTAADSTNDGVVNGIQFVDFKILQGGSGIDTFTIDTNFDGSIYGGDGNDIFNINAKVNELHGENGADIFNIHALVNNISGGSGNDSFIFYAGGDVTTANGDAGSDLVDFSNLNANYTITLNGSTINNIASVSRVIANGAYEFTLAATSGNNTWRVYDFDGSGTAADGTNDGVVNGIQFVDFKILQGGSGIDTFTIDTNFMGTIDGGVGNDIFNINAQAGSIFGGDGADTFNINALVNNISGGNGDDRFVFFEVGSVTTASGNDGDDIVDFSNLTAARTITLNGTRINNVDSVSRVIANSAYDFTLAATSGNNTWRIYDFDGSGTTADGTNDGVVNGIQFVDFKILQGGSGIDTFTIDTNFDGSIYGGDGNDIFNINAKVNELHGEDGADTFNIKAQVENIFGGNGDDHFVFFEGGSVTTASGDDGYDIVDLSNLTAARIITLNGTSINNVDSVSRVIANSAYDFTLEAASGNNIWRIYDFDDSGTAADGTNDGVLNGIQFVDFKILKGGSGIDTFTIDTNFDGSIYGVAGNNVFNVNANVNAIYGGDENDSFVLGNSGSVTTLNGGLGTNTLTGRNNNNVWTLTADDTGSLSTGNTTYINNFSNIQVLQGGNAVDIFNLDFAFSGIVKGGAGADIFNVNAETNILHGEDGNDSFRFNSDSNIGSANVIHGGDGSNDISGRETINTWEITSTNAGNVSVTSGTTYIASFNNIQTLNGGAAVDDFIINASIGTIKSGAGNNTFYVNTAVGHLQGGADNDHFIFGAAGSAQSISGAGGVNSLTGRNANNTWNITGAHAGNLGVTGAGLYVTNFSNIQNLQGGNSIDIFNINAIAGSVFGNAGNDQFVFNSNNNAGSAALIDGGADNNILIGRNAENTWTMLGANNGALSTTNGTNYVANFSAIQQLEGGNAVDSLVAINQDNDWNITGVNKGNLGASGSTSFITFTNIENLIGRQALDRFTFTSNQSYITGLIDGGSSATLASIQDSLDLTAVTSGVTVELGNSSSNHLNVVNIESITAYAGNPNNNVIIGASDNAYRWNITSLNTGSIERVTSPSLETSVNFNNFGELRGGTNSDRFNVQAQVSKSISGGDGEGIDLVDYSNRTEDVAITIGGNGSLGVTGINGIEGIIGNSGLNSAYNSTINVTDGNNTWTIGAFDSFSDGINDGTININGKIISFENFNRLIGGSGNDTFNYSALGQLIGLIDGGAGDNIVNASQSTKAQQFHVNGNELGATNIVRIKELIGNLSTNSVLVSQSSSNIWNINNQGIGRLNDSLRFSGITNLTGGNYVDVFNIDNIASLTGVINGSGGVDRVNLTGINSDISLGIGATAVADLKIADIEVVEANTNRNNTLIAEKSNDNAWEISARNAGKLNDTLSFSGFANLIGGEKSDVFSFINELSDISGFIDGNKGHDSLDLSISNRDAVVRIVSDNTTANNNNIRIKNIEEIAADARKNNQLIASDLDNLWTITATDAGRLSDVTSSSTIVFSNFKHLTGGNQNDTFNFESTGNITGFIDGAGHREQDVVDVSKSVNPNIVITAVGAESGYANIEKFIGNNITSSITGDNRVNNWVVHNNSGTINSSIMFEGFANLIGGNNQDTFLLDNAALSGYIDGSGGNDTFTLAQSSVAGGISGGAGDGDDVFNITVANGFSGTLDIRGGQGDDRLFISGGDANYKATHQQGVLQYTSPANLVYTANYSDIMEITDSVIADSLAVSGTSASDIFTLQNNKYWLNPTLSVNYLQKQNLIINGAADDQVKIDGTVSIAKTFTVNNASLIGENAGKIIAQNLELIATQDVGSNSDRLKLAVDNIYLKSTKGNVYIDEQDSLTIKEFSTSTTALFDLLIGGDLLSSISINYAGQFNANSQYGNILLNNTNTFTGNLNLKAAGNIAIKNSAAVNFEEVRAQNLSVEADGTVTGIGSIIVNGLTSISSGANVTFMHADNDLNSLAIVKANNVSLKDKNSLTLTGVSASGDVSLSAKETVNIASSCVNDCAENYGVRAKNLEIDTGAGAITVGKNVDVIDNLIFRANGITVNDALSAKNINLNAGAGTLLLSERGNLNGLAGNSIALSGNRIEQRSVIKGNGEISFVAADDIQMANGSLTESLSGNVTYRGKNIALGSIKAVNGSVNLTANGAISDNNGDDINIEANRWNADAIAGIGVGRFGSLGQDAIETDVNILSVRNAGKLQGDTKINILNTDSLIIEQLRNNGDISIANLTGDIILDNTNNEPFNINDGDARTQGGVINAGTNGGILTLSIPNGMVRAENKAVKSNPDIIADIATFDYSENTKFSFGERDRKIVMHIPSFYKQTARTSSIIWYLKKPLDTADSSTPIKNLMSNDQLIQIEGLSEIDPAIFTNVSNYIHDEVAILMPADQRFDEEDYAE